MTIFRDLFDSICELAEEVGHEMKHWWDEANKRIKRLLWALLLWPVLMIIVAFTATDNYARVINPILVIALMGYAAYQAIKLANPATLAILLTPGAIPEVGAYLRSALIAVATKIGLILLVEVLLGMYFSLVPISNNRGLVPILLLAFLAFGLLQMLKVKGVLRFAVISLIVVLTLMMFFGGKHGDAEKAAAKEKSVARYVPHFKRAVCEDAWRGDIQEPPGNTFVVKLRENCFDSFITLPEGWHNWNYQPIGDDPEWWFSPWFKGSQNPEGIFYRNARPDFAYHSRTFRLQGKAGQEIRFYTSDANVQSTPSAAAPAGQPPFVAVGNDEGFCEATAEENEAADFKSSNPVDITEDKLHSGCFVGPLIIPDRWNLFRIDKSRNVGDWTRIWCEGHPKPSEVYPYYKTQFALEDIKDCGIIYLQGKGSVKFTRVSQK